MKFFVYGIVWGSSEQIQPKELLEHHKIEFKLLPRTERTAETYLVDIDDAQLTKLCSDQRVDVMIHRFRMPKGGWTQEQKGKGLHEASSLSFDVPGGRFRQR